MDTVNKDNFLFRVKDRPMTYQTDQPLAQRNLSAQRMSAREFLNFRDEGLDLNPPYQRGSQILSQLICVPFTEEKETLWKPKVPKQHASGARKNCKNFW